MLDVDDNGSMEFDFHYKNMVTHIKEYGTLYSMKTTLELSDPLLNRVRRIARRNQRTLRSIVEEALHRFLDEEPIAPPFHLRKSSFAGQGLQPSFENTSWEHIREAIYQGRGS